MHPAAQMGTSFLCAATVPRPCAAASTFAACPWLESCLAAGPLAGVSAPAEAMLYLPIAGGSGRAPAGRIWLRAGTLRPGRFLPRDGSAKMPLSSPQPRSLPAREEGKVMAGQDWLSPLPWAGGQRWGCPGCSGPCGAAVAPADPSVVSRAGRSHPPAGFPQLSPWVKRGSAGTGAAFPPQPH